MKNVLLRTPPWPVLLFFLGYLLLGCWLVGDYGISWDEPIQRQHGMVSWDYVNDLSGGFFFDQKLTEHDLATYRNRDYGVLFSMTCFAIERTLNLSEFRHLYLLRHVMGFLVFFCGVFFFYKLLQYRFQDWRWGLLAALLLILSPRLFGHSFFNPKDTLVLSAFIVSTYTLVRFVDEKSLKRLIFHAIACGILMNTRVVGICIPLLTIGLLVVEWLKDSNKLDHLKKYAYLTPLFAASFFLFTLLFWPFLWSAPIENLMYVFKSMGKFRWEGKILYWGKFVWSTQLPWHYIPSWMATTTPIAYTFAFLVGMGTALRILFTNHFRFYNNQNERTDLIFLALFLGPLLAIIYIGSVLYDGWRQLYFIYPGFLATAVVGLYHTWSFFKKRKKTKKPIFAYILAGLFLINVLDTAFFMTYYHPFQNVYFNLFAGKDTVKRMEQDYWGVHFKQAYEKLLELDDSDTLLVRASNYPGTENYNMLQPDQQKRFEYNWENKSEGYYFTNYRFKWEYEKFTKKQHPFDKEFHTIKVRGTPIIGIYKYSK